MTARDYVGEFKVGENDFGHVLPATVHSGRTTLQKSVDARFALANWRQLITLMKVEMVANCSFQVVGTWLSIYIYLVSSAAMFGVQLICDDKSKVSLAQKHTQKYV